jgi:hypothetical protein
VLPVPKGLIAADGRCPEDQVFVGIGPITRKKLTAMSATCIAPNQHEAKAELRHSALMSCLATPIMKKLARSNKKTKSNPQAAGCVESASAPRWSPIASL